MPCHALLMQVVDLAPGFLEKHNAFEQDAKYESILEADAWDYLAKNGDDIVFYPPTLEGLYYDNKTSMEFEILALKYGLNLNMTYMSRDLTAQADKQTLDLFEKRAEGYRDAGDIYIFFDAARDNLPDASKYGINYYEIDGYVVGTEHDLSGIAGVKQL